MRIVKQIPHPLLVVEIFVYAEKYSLKIKYKGLEQSFPLPSDQLENIEGELSTPNHPFYTQVLQNFDAMQRSKVDLLQSMSDHGSEEEEEEIV